MKTKMKNTSRVARPCCAVSSILLVLALFSLLPSLTAAELVFIGRGDQNIHVARFDTNSGALTGLHQVAALLAPSFLCLAPNHHSLYAVSEGQSPQDSAITAFAVAPNGDLAFLNRQPSGGSGPCCVATDSHGQCVLAANYGSGSMAVFTVQPNGALGPRSAFIQDHGSSVNPDRQQGPHSHCALTDPADHFAFDCDLGLDQVLVYKIDPASGTLTPNDPPFFSGKPGSGPRHLVFHPNGRFAYLINELDSTIVSLAYDPSLGTLSALQSSPLLPADFTGKNTAAEVVVHPSGQWVYGSNRGDNSLVVFACDPATGRLTYLQRLPSGGKIPRNFEIDPTGSYLLAANQDSDNIVTFRIDPATGKLSDTGNAVQIPRPMCLKFLVTPF
jgi:6-phosphogluconolactonase